MDPTRNPAEDTDFDFDAWQRWQNLRHAWDRVRQARQQKARYQPLAAPEPPVEPEIVYLLPVPN
ncbi:hypothetical protein [Hymenobacter lucidus]|uniref:Uncharacterized protein n=1 Tax=Hymenobacter lucidus TaxID=2880930 RepID=A0ABS8AKZ1_9BACT|nr:hypothetical protein [Hymenobacter lucidus]MCB2406868.1 hypothetical protein [Hymenobacter lucidus]